MNFYTENFVKTLDSIYCNSFPLKTKFVSARHRDNPWITPNLLKLFKAKSQYFILYKRGLVSREENRRFGNRVKDIVRKSKLNYYRNAFNMETGNMRETWSLIKELMGSSPHSKLLNSINVDGSLCSDDGKIANAFNTYFSSIAVELDNNLPQSNLNPIGYITEHVQQSLFLTPVTCEECSIILKNIKKTKQSQNQITVKLFIDFHFIFYLLFAI